MLSRHILANIEIRVYILGGELEIVEFGQNIFHVDVPFKIFNIHIGNRMTVVRLDSGELWVHSPISPHQDLVDHMNSLGPTRYVVAPNLFHHIHLPNFKEHFPEAQFYAVPELSHKRSGFEFDHELADDAKVPWTDEIEGVMLEGMPKVNEWVFFHKRSKTLIVTDLMFNFVDFPNWRTSLFAGLNRCKNRLHWSWFFYINIDDREAFSKSLKRVQEWDFDRILLAHGAPVIENSKERFSQGLRKII